MSKVKDWRIQELDRKYNFGWNDPRKDPVFLAYCAFITALVRHESAKLGSRGGDR